jgi:exopolysaccharide biosynthesis protein
MANIMRSLGASDALNLDGGGSSVMVVKGKLTGKPSDTTGERMVADSLVFTSNNKD